MNKIHELAQLGQSLWIDYIRRSFMTSGDLQRLIDQGLRGMTSNPSIFEKAIAHSDDYAADLEKLARAGKTPDEIFNALVIDDIRLATDLFRPVYEQTGGSDGFVSIEVNPLLADDTETTIAEAKRLWAEVDRPNLMVKIPATKAGIPAITAATAAGINVNITLIFSLARYAEVMAAYIAGLSQRVDEGQPVERIRSVASFFVSRVDSKVDKLLEEIVRKEGPQAGPARSLFGQAAIANARAAYSQFRAVFEGERFVALKQYGANLQRPLWASTSTKNPAYSDILYVQKLIAPHTVNTLPQETLDAFLDHGEVRLTLEKGVDQAQYTLQALGSLGISMEQVTQELEDEGVAAFSKSFKSLMDSIEQKRQELGGVAGGHGGGASAPSPEQEIDFRLGKYAAAVETALDEIAKENILPRIWQGDHTVWSPQRAEISDRLAWLRSPEEMAGSVADITAFAQEVKKDGYTHAVLLGMGGSSLAPEMFGRTFSNPDALRLSILDSTDPGAVLAVQEALDPARTLFIVSTKSGTTEETLSFFKYFYNWVLATGVEQPGRHFAAITDPGSKLVDLARQFGFRRTFTNNPDIGGRYSALSYFGLVPAALAGADLEALLGRAAAMSRRCAAEAGPRQNPAARLGAALGELAKAGRDKVTFILPGSAASFGDWVEQLIAESTGKKGKGILPVAGEPLGAPAVYGDDRLFVHFSLPGSDSSTPASLQTLADSGLPIIHISLTGPYDLGGQIFLWELATAIAGYRLGINPFDQPNVESAKQAARAMVAAYRQSGALPSETPVISQDGISVFGPAVMRVAGDAWHLEGKSPSQALAAFLNQSRPGDYGDYGDYIALQAFVQPGDETATALGELRLRLRDRYHLATTAGFGPRFLHSTGQLHKGDAGRGLFIQFTHEPPRDAPIPLEAGKPDSAMTFGVLELAQALGDRRALLDAGRRAIRFHFTGDVPAGLRRLAEALE